MANVTLLTPDADSKTVKQAAQTLGSAFSEDPFLHFIQGPTALTPSQWSTRLSAMYHGCLKFTLRRPPPEAYVHITPDAKSAALWFRVQEGWKVSGHGALSALYGVVRSFRWKTLRFLRLNAPLDEQHPKEPHMYLWIIGTAAEERGKGYGSEVIKHMLEMCDEEGLPAYLESSASRNVPFYERHGFKVMGNIEGLPKDCPPIVKMWREPKK